MLQEQIPGVSRDLVALDRIGVGVEGSHIGSELSGDLGRNLDRLSLDGHIVQRWDGRPPPAIGRDRRSVAGAAIPHRAICMVGVCGVGSANPHD